MYEVTHEAFVSLEHISYATKFNNIGFVASSIVMGGSSTFAQNPCLMKLICAKDLILLGVKRIPTSISSLTVRKVYLSFALGPEVLSFVSLV